MGVQGLWSILEPTGHSVSAESLRGKVLAVDVSIWLHQAVKGIRDRDGNPVPNAHLVALFHRVCHLLHSGIRPVFVFDGGVPALKRSTMAGRRQKKIEASTRSDSARRKLLTNYLQRRVQLDTNAALPPSLRIGSKLNCVDSSLISPSKLSREVDDCGDLNQLVNNFDRSCEGYHEFDDDSSSNCSDDFEESNDRNYADNFSTIVSPQFDSLELEAQHEILFQMQESKKTNSWNKMAEMPRDAGDFSAFQMNRLLKRRFLQKKIQSVQHEMGQKHIHVQNFDELEAYEAEFGVDPQIVGSKDCGALFLKPKATVTVTNPSGPGDVTKIDQSIPGPSHRMINEEEIDLQVAIQLSLSSRSAPSADVSDDEDDQLIKALEMSLQDSNVNVQVSTAPKKVSPNPRRSLEGTRSPKQKSILAAEVAARRESKRFEETIAEEMSTPCYKFLGWVGFNDKISPRKQPPPSTHSLQTARPPRIAPAMVTISDESPSSDEDFEEVQGEGEMAADEKSLMSELFKKQDYSTLPNKNGLQIHLNLDNSLEDDLFADVFTSSATDEKSKVTCVLQPDSLQVQAAPIPTEAATRSPIGILHISPVSSSCFDELDYEKPLTVKEIETPVIEISDQCTKGFMDTECQIAEDVQNENALVTLEQQQLSETPLGIDLAAQRSTTVQEETIPRETSVRMLSMEFMQQQEKLNSEHTFFRTEMQSQDRISTSITDQMYLEAQELLALFGIPYIVSPMEAEAQCAFLDEACLTDGTITDDSDIWLFGALRVYKNFFSQGSTHIKFFEYANIVQKLYLEREKLILMAMLCGSDYTNGIEGVGPITALEIIADDGFHDNDAFSILLNFQSWWAMAQDPVQQATMVGSKPREKWRKLRIHSGFPSRIIFDAYMCPNVDTSTEPFKWAEPNREALKSFAHKRFGWNALRTESILGPALKRFETKKQATLDSFLQLHHSTSPLSTQSKRMRRVMQKLAPHEPPAEIDLSSDSDTEPVRGKRKELSGSKSTVTRKRLKKSDLSGTLQNSSIPKGTGAPIPQRIKDAERRSRNRAKAVAVLKKEKEQSK